MGSRAINTPHHLTTVPLARLGTDEVGGYLFLAVWNPQTNPTQKRGSGLYGLGGQGGYLHALTDWPLSMLSVLY